jgi:hypothetical protein
MGTAQRGRHIQSRHPQNWVPSKGKSVKAHAAKMLQTRQAAKEIERLGGRGVRFLPKVLDPHAITMVNNWIKNMKNSSRASDNLLIAGIDQSEDGISSIKEFNQIKASIKAFARLGLDDKPGLWDRKTHYNPTIAGEVLKLAFLLGQSFSFAVHLLLLYGLEAMAEEVATTGPHPPSGIGSPSKAIDEIQKQAARVDVQKKRDAEFWARNPSFDPTKRPAAHVITLTEDDLAPKSKADGYTYR